VWVCCIFFSLFLFSSICGFQQKKKGAFYCCHVCISLSRLKTRKEKKTNTSMSSFADKLKMLAADRRRAPERRPAALWTSDDSLRYVVDTAGDRNNLVYGSLYRGDVPAYTRAAPVYSHLPEPIDPPKSMSGRPSSERAIFRALPHVEEIMLSKSQRRDRHVVEEPPSISDAFDTFIARNGAFDFASFTVPDARAMFADDLAALIEKGVSPTGGSLEMALLDVFTKACLLEKQAGCVFNTRLRRRRDH
jgi:hypothetical protein